MSVLLNAIIRKRAEGVTIAGFIHTDELFKSFLAVEAPFVERGKEMVELGFNVCGEDPRIISTENNLQGRVICRCIYPQPAE